MDETVNLFGQHIDKVKDIKTEKLMNRLKKEGFANEDIQGAQEFMDKLRKGELDAPEDSPFEDDFLGDFDEPYQDDLFGDDASLFEEYDPTEEAEFEEPGFYECEQEKREQELSRLLKATSINKLFRRIARAIHPDLVQDEQEKEQRHSQMSQLLQARDDKDITKILQMHKEVFGYQPEGIPEGDYDKLTRIINLKIQELRDKKDEAFGENPLYYHFYQAFGQKNAKQEARSIENYISSIQEEKMHYDQVRLSVRNLSDLRQFLDARMYMGL